MKTLKDEEFKRLTGVSRKVYEKMLEVVKREMRNFGRPSKLPAPVCYSCPPLL